jgi:hypothetical protein
MQTGATADRPRRACERLLHRRPLDYREAAAQDHAAFCITLLKIGIMVAFFFPMLVLGYLLWSGAVPQHDVRAAAFFIALAFLIPPLALAVIGVRSGFQRVREFARYVELSDRISVTVLLAILMPVWLVSLVFCAWGAASFL